MKKLVALLLAVLMVVALFAGCAPKAEDPATDEPATDEPATDEPAKEEPKDEPAEEEPERAADLVEKTAADFDDYFSWYDWLTTSEGSKTDEAFTICYSQCVMNHPFRTTQIAVVEEYIAANYPNINWVWNDANDDAVTQIANVENLLLENPDVLVMTPVQEDPLCDIIDEAMSMGIPVLTIDRTANTKVTAHIGASNTVIGKNAAIMLNDALGGEGKILELQGTQGASPTIDRHDSFVEELVNYPGLEVIQSDYADYLREPGMTITEDAIQAWGDELDAIYTHSAETTVGAYLACEAAGRDDIIIVGGDGGLSEYDLIKEGKIYGTTSYPFCAPELIIYAVKLAMGIEIPEITIIPSSAITAENVDQYYVTGY